MVLKLLNGRPVHGTTGHLQNCVSLLQAPAATGAHNTCFQQVQDDISKARSVNKDWEFVSIGTEISLVKFVPEYFTPLTLNLHLNGILYASVVPLARLQALQAQAETMLGKLLNELDYVGVMAMECFRVGDHLMINELAPRVHNSGHWTIEGAVTSQFENHIRAICGLPLGDTGLTARRVEMTNLIGDDANAALAILAERDAHVHLYGKTVRKGRKMGHITRLLR